MNNFTHHLLDIGWQRNKETLRPIASLRELALQSDSGSPSALQQSNPSSSSTHNQTLDLTLPYQFNWQLSTEYFCPGYRDEKGELIPCPDQHTITQAQDRCEACENKDGFKIAFFMNAAPNARMSKQLAKTHYIYLAWFWPHIVKVGTVVEGREETRLIEQDALYATIVAMAPGTQIGKLERDIAKFLNLTTTVRSNQKAAGLKRQIDTEKARTELLSLADRLANASADSVQPYLLSRKEIFIVDHTQNPHVYYPEVETTITPIENPQFLSGTYLGLRGNQLFVENNKKVYQISTKKLTNRLLSPSEEKLEYALANKQQSLF